MSSLDEICTIGALPTQDLSSTLQTVIASGPRSSILVQVISITEIGVSAGSLREVYETRKEEKRITDKGGQAERTRVVRNTEEDGDAVGEGSTVKYPRSMLKLEVTDGFTTLRAIEYKRIPELSLEDAPLGCKVGCSARVI